MFCKLWNENVNHWCVFSSACCPWFPIQICQYKRHALAGNLFLWILAHQTGSPTAIKESIKRSRTPASIQILSVICTKSYLPRIPRNFLLTFDPQSHYCLHVSQMISQEHISDTQTHWHATVHASFQLRAETLYGLAVNCLGCQIV